MGQGVTTDSQLNRIGKKVFKQNWIGVYPVDVKAKTIMPRLNTKTGNYYGIINVDKSSEPGSHWLSIIYNATAGKWYIWDSFGRSSKRLIPKFIKTIGANYIDLNTNGANQKDSEDSCGQKSIAVLIYTKKHGVHPAAKI